MHKLIKTLFMSHTSKAQHKTIPSEALLVDVRTPAEFASGSVPGAINVPLDGLLTQLPKLKRHNHIVVFCRSGARSAQAKRLLEQNGCAQVVNGGTWQDVNDAVRV